MFYGGTSCPVVLLYPTLIFQSSFQDTKIQYSNTLPWEKKMKKIIVVIVFTVVPIYSQEINPYNFFPSSIGNIWEYYQVNSGKQRYKLVKDSILSDQSKLIFFQSDSSASYRIDTVGNVFYNPNGYNWLYYKLKVDSGDTWIVDSIDNVNRYGLKAIVKRKYPGVIFGKPTTIMEIYYGYMPYDSEVYLEGWSEFLALGIGEIEKYDASGLGPQKVLVGCIIDGDTMGTITSVTSADREPISYQLYQNYPNPFNPSTSIRYQLPKDGFVTLKVYDVLGKEVATLVNEVRIAGEYTVTFDGSGLPSGVYVYRLKAGSYVSSHKMLLLK